MAATNKITFYDSLGNESPNSYRVRIALEEANIEHDTIHVDLFDKPAWYQEKVNSEGKVPFLVYGGPKLHPDEPPSPEAATIPESIIILNLLAELFPTSGLLPADPILRAKARLFIHAVDTKFLPACRGVQRLLPAEEGYALGEQWSIADAVVMPFLLRIPLTLALKPFTVKEGEAEKAVEALESPRFARISRYIKQNLARPSFAATWDEERARKQTTLRLQRMATTGEWSPGFRVALPQKK
ncbi:hypothetical protein C8Q74DRAFT_1220184 [Fomes fomentarius]|nr:hypothetical protein C8Q74DRAFT_1220184 [Fomes fomentarius]